MKLFRFTLGWMIWFAFIGCTLAAQPTTSFVPNPIAIDKPVDTARAYPRGRFIGIKANVEAACPEISGWEESQLFPPFRRGNPDSVPKELRRFCLYILKPNSREARYPFPTSPGLIRIDPDPVAVAPAGLEDELRGPLAERFLEQVGRTGVSLPIEAGKKKVRLAFLDTLPTGKGASRPICSGHGDFMFRVGRALTCDGGGDRCATWLTTQLALPIQQLDPTQGILNGNGCGGSLGTIAGLAVAISHEIDAWKDRGQEPHLVINLSLAWDGALFGGLNQKLWEMPAGPQAVYAALQVAQKEGALVIAAVGNDKSGPNSTDGPLLPAAWETFEPEAGCCSEPLHTPLIYAVGGLRANDEPIANARRPGSMPSLAAFADHAALNDGALPLTSTYTGTSVAAAVASSVAAVVWYEKPDLSAEGVIEILRQSGGSVIRPEFTFGRVRRISLCSALRTACPSCVPTCCRQRDKEPIVLHELEGGAPSTILGMETDLVILPNCSPNRILRARMAPALSERELCPARILNDRSSEAWLHPQPGGDPCPNCIAGPPPRLLVEAGGAAARAFLYLEIRKDWVSETDGRLMSATLEIEGGDGSTRWPVGYLLPRPPKGIYSATYKDTIELPSGALPAGSRAYISWQVQLSADNFYSIRSPLLIARSLD